ncbi:MAG: dCTP deaminase [Thermodesulfobacteriota bacterium]
MILSDVDIHKAINENRIKVTPLNASNIHAAGIDLTLGDKIKVFDSTNIEIIDPLAPNTYSLTKTIEVPQGKFLILHPNSFVLGITDEWIEMPDDIVGRIEGRSSFGRLGLSIHITAGFIDPGFRGKLTLEIKNQNRIPIKLYTGMRVCQIAFMMLSSPAMVPYYKKHDSKYLNQDEPRESQIYQELAS